MPMDDESVLLQKLAESRGLKLDDERAQLLLPLVKDLWAMAEALRKSDILRTQSDGASGEGTKVQGQ
jgi:hypothetical protein